MRIAGLHLVGWPASASGPHHRPERLRLVPVLAWPAVQ